MAGPVLILGASGFLGARLVRAAALRDVPVVAVSRRPERRPGRQADPWGIVEQALDLAARGAVETLVRGVAPRSVILAAALARGDACERDPGLARELNARLPGRVARAASAVGARLVHVSTDLVFGAEPPRRGARFDEDDPPAPLSVYGATKAEGERAALAADALVVRLQLLYGDSGGRGLGASEQVTAAALRGERPFLFTDEHRTPLDVDDAAAALIELCGRSEVGLLHVAGPERLDRLELGLLALCARGLSREAARAAVDAGPRAARGLGNRPADVSLDAARARTLLATPLRAPAEVLGTGPLDGATGRG